LSEELIFYWACTPGSKKDVP